MVLVHVTPGTYSITADGISNEDTPLSTLLATIRIRGMPSPEPAHPSPSNNTTNPKHPTTTMSSNDINPDYYYLAPGFKP
jgi:hypothetical protein